MTVHRVAELAGRVLPQIAGRVLPQIAAVSITFVKQGEAQDGEIYRSVGPAPR